MKCPQCGRDLGHGMLPARCPACGANLASPKSSIRTQSAADTRRGVEGLTGIGKGNRQNRTRHILQGLLALVLVISFIGLLWFAFRGFRSPDDLTVPDVVGWRLERAQEELEEAGYAVTVSEQVSTTSESGLVLEQNPRAGTRAAEGTSVELLVARSLTMPDVVGKTLADAEADLDRQGIAYEVREEPSDEADGTVVAASVPVGNVVQDDTVVTLSVATRPEVPELVGRTQEEATKLATAQRLKLKVETVTEADGKPAGTVVSQDPVAGTKVNLDSTVTVKVVSSVDTQLKQAAERVLTAVYGTDPANDGVGAALKPLLSPSSSYANASAHDVWWNLVKRGGRYLEQPSELQSLPRSIVSSSLEVDAATRTVRATVTVRWDWTGLPGAGVGESEDTREVTMTFDKEGRLIDFTDEQTDVPFFKVEG